MVTQRPQPSSAPCTTQTTPVGLPPLLRPGAQRASLQAPAPALQQAAIAGPLAPRWSGDRQQAQPLGAGQQQAVQAAGQGGPVRNQQHGRLTAQPGTLPAQSPTSVYPEPAGEQQPTGPYKLPPLLWRRGRRSGDDHGPLPACQPAHWIRGYTVRAASSGAAWEANVHNSVSPSSFPAGGSQLDMLPGAIPPQLLNSIDWCSMRSENRTEIGKACMTEAALQQLTAPGRH